MRTHYQQLNIIEENINYLRISFDFITPLCFLNKNYSLTLSFLKTVTFSLYFDTAESFLTGIKFNNSCCTLSV